MYWRFWVLCWVTGIAAVGVIWLAYRIRSSDLGIGAWPRELVVVGVIAAAQALLLFCTFRLLGWTHWLQYLVVAAIAAIGHKAAHLNEIDDYAPYILAATQLAFFWVALGPLKGIFGDLSRRFPMFP